MSSCNVLITSAGRRVSLVKLFQRALRQLNVLGAVHVVDLQVHAPTLQVADTGRTVPQVTSPDYVDRLLEYCRKNKICLVVPTIDTELHILSSHKKRFGALGIELLVCSDEINEIAFDKRKTQSFFENSDIPVPRMYTLDEALQLKQECYPLLMKPAQGSSSVGVTIINNRDELRFFYGYLKNPIIQERVEGEEYTVDLLFNMQGALQCVVPRLRMETRAGEVSKGVTVRQPAVLDAVVKAAAALKGAVGCVTMQCFLQKDGVVRFIEINPRFGGGFPLAAEAGADFPRWLLQMVLGIELDCDLHDRWQDGLVMLRYDEEIFVQREKLGL